ncbi:unnamed protein product [Aureobasidium uvarum]|uniref:Uncharacterized protein n=1 Tax=Aureobasidium uvarum TaxID=2773716 RepID=A0A9N8KD60_9PEZI|nr:unnamed protein product [Aureobasidium uvarum]
MNPQGDTSTATGAPDRVDDVKNDVKMQDPAKPSDPIDPAGPDFLHLAVEKRNKIYHQLLDPKGTKTLSIEPPKSIKAINKLLNISPQVNSEVTALIASETKVRVQAGLYYDLKLEPHTVAIPSKSTKKKSKKNKKQDITTAELSDELKFWKMDIIVFTAEGIIRVKAEMDFKDKTVKVSLPDFEDSMGMFSSNYCDYLFGDFEDAFLKPMKTFTDKDGFDGFVVKDVSDLLHKIEMPCPKYFWDGDELFGEDDEEWDEEDEWDDYDDYDDYGDEGEGEGYDGFGEEDEDEDEYSDEEDYSEEVGDGDEKASEDDDGQLLKPGGKVEVRAEDAKAEDIKTEEIKAEVAKTEDIKADEVKDGEKIEDEVSVTAGT